jgi:proteasome lid subunit RPN8/RPN11
MNDDRHGDPPSSSEWRVPAGEQLETDAYHIWKPRPLLRSVHWKPTPAVPRDAAAGSYDVFVDQRVFTAMHSHLWNATPGEEPFGFLSGDLCEDPDTGRRYLIISAAVPAHVSFEEDSSEQIRGEAMVAVQLDLDQRPGVLAGWYHRHRKGDVKLSEADVATHERLFPEPWHVALLFVTDPSHPVGGCFRRALKGLAGDTPLPFFETVSNESLLARGLRRSYIDWVNVETVDSIQREPPPIPEVPSEPQPEIAPEAEAAPESEMTPAPEIVPEPEIASEPEIATEPEIGTEPEIAPEREHDQLPTDDVAGPDSADSVFEEQTATAEERAIHEEAPAIEEAAPGPVAPDEALDVVLPLLEDVEAAKAELEIAEQELGITSEEHETAVIPSADLLEVPLDTDVEELPEPGWDAEKSAPAAPARSIDDVDLESFVSEVETADVAKQVEGAPDPEEVQPDWDDDDATGGLRIEPLAPPTIGEPELPVEPEELEELEEPEELEPPEVEDVDDLPTDVVPRKKKHRRTRSVWIVAGLILVGAVAASLITFGGLPTGDSPDVGEPGPAAPAEAGSPGEGGAVEAGADDLSAGQTEAPVGAADSASAEATVAELDSLGESLVESISRYYGLAVALDDGRATCAELQAAYVEVDDRWIEYNVLGKARFAGRLPDDLSTRDERLYSGVQDVEVEFGRSGCPRP